MANGSLLPVIAGLATGISFIMLFSAVSKPVGAMTDDELRKLVADQYPQFQALKERYPNTTLEEIQRYESVTYVHYTATKEPRDDSIFEFPGPKMLGITLEIQSLSGRSLYAFCGSGVSKVLPATVQAINTTDCLETGVFEPDPAGNELNGAVFVEVGADNED